MSEGAWPGPAAARCVRSCCARLCSNVGLCALVAAYALLGAALFEALEAGFEAQQRGRAQRHRRDCLDELWDITVRMNVLYERNWTRQLRSYLICVDYEAALHACCSAHERAVRAQLDAAAALVFNLCGL
ncbi:hypothetical protein R5R35_013028 [Gryllus longicercus]|uniref:Uncharacterized protein n=1 Tax=Gryllus longicercus TaxID=2509291 RepID=A0AAN9YXW3_9ORTH